MVRYLINLILFQVVGASDKDRLGQLSYSIVETDEFCPDIFRIDNTTGLLYMDNTRHCLDYDVSHLHTLLIQAQDGIQF